MEEDRAPEIGRVWREVAAGDEEGFVHWKDFIRDRCLECEWEGRREERGEGRGREGRKEGMRRIRGDGTININEPVFESVVDSHECDDAVTEHLVKD